MMHWQVEQGGMALLYSLLRVAESITLREFLISVPWVVEVECCGDKV